MQIHELLQREKLLMKVHMLPFIVSTLFLQVYYYPTINEYILSILISYAVIIHVFILLLHVITQRL
jgi:hypothetical protein